MEQLVETLLKSVYQRSEYEKQELYDFFSNYDFFSDLISQDESEALFKDCVNSLIIENYSNDSILQPGVYVVLSGSSKFLNPKPEKLPKFIKVHNQVKQSDPAQPEIAFEPGTIFGQVHKQESYFIKVVKNLSLACLSSAAFVKISEKAEEILNEKFELMKSLDIFKNWSRKAVKNAAKAFGKSTYRKGNCVYKENDKPEFIYLVADGEFKLTQGFVISIDPKEQVHEFGSLGTFKGPQIRKSIKKTNLQVVLKQRGEFFGHNEFINKSEKRELSVICNSNYAVLYEISEKEFFKRFAHPETMRLFEEQNKIFQIWTSRRLVNLKSTENYKVNITHSPNKSSNAYKRHKTPAPSLKRMIAQETTQSKLPRIIDRIIGKTQGKVDQSFTIFSTELSTDYSRLRKYC